jgi:hypothetical protein
MAESWQAAYLKTAYSRQKQAREEAWRKHVAVWQRSGLSQAKYCRRHNLRPSYFSWWKIELARRDGRDAPAAATFVPLKLEAAEPAADYACEIVLRNGCRLRLGSSVAAQWAAELASALEGQLPC